MKKLALGMIVRGSEKDRRNLERGLKTILPYVDKAFITTTGTTEEHERTVNDLSSQSDKIVWSHKNFDYKIEKKAVDWCKEFFGATPYMKEGDKIFVFDDARNYNFSQIPEEYDYVLWMDSDDIFRGGQKLRDIVERAAQGGVEALYLNYIYQSEFTPEGKIKAVIIEHLRERIVKNEKGLYKWVGVVHETLIEQRPSRKTDIPDMDLVHLADNDDRVASLKRNLPSLEYAIYRSEGKDPRHVYYLAKALYDVNQPETNELAMKLINAYVAGEHQSGWTDERAQAWEYQAELYRRKGEHNNSIKCLMNALIETPEIPTIYLNLAASYMLKEDYDRALFWVRIATTIPEKKTTLVKSPRDMQIKLLEIIFNSCLHLSKIDEAWAAIVKLYEYDPKNKQYQDMYKFMENLRTERDLSKYVMDLSNFLAKSGQAEKIKPLIISTPAQIQNNPFIQELIKQNFPVKHWDKSEVAIFCGPGFTNWSPKRLETPQGSFIGGSEEAVINVSKQLSKLGYTVTVYADPGADEGMHDGVEWLPYYKFNSNDKFNILIGWRNIRFFDPGYDAKLRVLWNHDIQNPVEYTEDRLKKVDKVFFLSKWHRDNVPELPEEKVVITSNGI